MTELDLNVALLTPIPVLVHCIWAVLPVLKVCL